MRIQGSQPRRVEVQDLKSLGIGGHAPEHADPERQHALAGRPAVGAIGLARETSTVLATVTIDIIATQQLVLLGEFVADSSRTPTQVAAVVGDLQIDGNTVANTELNELTGTASASVSVTTSEAVAPGPHRIDLRGSTTADGVIAHESAARQATSAMPIRMDSMVRSFVGCVKRPVIYT